MGITSKSYVVPPSSETVVSSCDHPSLLTSNIFSSPKLISLTLNWWTIGCCDHVRRTELEERSVYNENHPHLRILDNYYLCWNLTWMKYLTDMIGNPAMKYLRKLKSNILVKLKKKQQDRSWLAIQRIETTEVNNIQIPYKISLRFKKSSKRHDLRESK